MGAMSDRKMRSNYRKSRQRAQKEYNDALVLIKRTEASIQATDSSHGHSLDMNKVPMLLTAHNRMLNRLCGTYNIKSIWMDAARQMKQNKNMAFNMAIEKVKYKKLKHLIKQNEKLVDVEDIVSVSAQSKRPGGKNQGVLSEASYSGDENDTINTQDAKNIRMQKTAMKKLGQYVTKESHKEVIERFFKLLPE